MTTTLTLKDTPARIEDYSSTAAAPTTKDGGPTPVKAKTIDITINVTRNENELEAVFPGLRHALKAAAGGNDKNAGTKAPSFSWTVARKLPPLTVTLTDTLGNLVLSCVNAKVKGKPTVRVSAGVEEVVMPLRFVASLDEDALHRMEEHLGVDLFADVAVSQADIEDVPAPATDSTKKPKPPKRGKGDKVTLSLVDDGAGDTDAPSEA